MPPTIASIRAWLQDSDVNLRRAGAEAAGRLGWQAVELVPDLIRALGDEHKLVTRNAAVSLGKINPPPAEAVDALIQIIARDDDEADLVLQEIAAWALGRIGSAAERAVPALEAFGKREFLEGWGEDACRLARENAAEAVQRIRSAWEKTRPASPYVVETEKKVTVIRDVDVLVVGSGPAGLIAAAGAARAGARTLIIEKHATVFPAIVYSGTAGIFNCFRTITAAETEQQALVKGDLNQSVREREAATADAARKEGCVRQVIGGAPWDFIKHLTELGGFIYRNELEAIMCRRLQVDPEVAQYGAITFLENQGVDMLVHSPGCAPILDGNRVAGVYVEIKSGRRAILAKAVVDASGESDIAAQAGAPTALGQDIGAMVGSLLWVLENFPGEPDLPFRSAQDSPNGPDPQKVREIADKVGFEMSRFADGRNAISYRLRGHGAFVGHYLDGGDGEDASIGELTARKFAFEFIRFCKEHVPGFEEARLRQISPQILWRGVRCIIGDYYMTKEDVNNRARFDDAVYLHRAVRYDSPDDYCHVPYRALLPRDVEGMLVAGKCASGASSIRSTGSCMAMGQAAGAAAALAAQRGTTPREVKVAALQDELRRQGAILDEPNLVDTKGRE